MKRKNKIAIIALGSAVVLTLGASLAYFTDRADSTASGNAGTVAIDLASDVNLLDADGKDILNPGDLRDASFKVTNEGNKSIDVKETILLEAFDRNGDPIALTEENGQAQYELYYASDVEQDANGSWQPKSGSTPLAVRTATLASGQILYEVPEYTLNGSSTQGKSVGIGFTKPAQNVGESDSDYEARVATAYSAYLAANPEVDANRELESGVNTIQHDSDIVLIMRGSTNNDFQASSVRLTINADALQHRNTGDNTWTTIKTEVITFGETTLDVVPVESVITDANYSADETVNP